MILIRIDVGPKIGIGHLIRSIALSEALMAQGQSVAMFGGELTDELCQFLPDAASFIFLDNPSEEDLLKLNENQKLAAIVVDSYSAEKKCYEEFKKHFSRAKLFAVDDFGEKIGFPVDGVLNFGWSADPKRYPPELRRFSAIGHQYSPVRKSLQSARHEGRSYEKVERLYLSMGGADPMQQTERFLKFFADMESKIEIDVVIGPLFSSTDYLKKFKDKRFHIHQSPREVSSLIAKADLAIVAAGTTCTEIACLGTPMIVLPTVENQVPVAEGIRNNEAGFVLPPLLDVTNDLLSQTISEAMNDRTKRESYAKKAQLLMDGRGAERLAKFILN